MAWIKSHQELERHPKTLDLMSAMGWDIDTTIGKLHRFWWWCVDYAPDGDLRKHNDARIGGSVGLNGEDAAKFTKVMVESCWIDRDPYFRVHDWWDHAGSFLQVKFKHTPNLWREIQALYEVVNGCNNSSNNCSNNTTDKIRKDKKRKDKKRVVPADADPPTGHPELVAHYCQHWKTRYGSDYQFSGGKDGKHVADILAKSKSLDVAKGIVDSYFADDSQFVVSEQAHSLGYLVSQFNKYLAKHANKKHRVAFFREDR